MLFTSSVWRDNPGPHTSNYTELLFLSLIFGLLFRFLDFAICSGR